MTKKIMLIAVIWSLIMISCVGLIQAIVELRTEGRVQMANFFLDTFVTPLKRARALHGVSAETALKLDSLAARPGGADAQRLAEEALALVQEMRAQALNINPYYRDDSTRPEHLRIDALGAGLDTLLEEIESGAEAAGLSGRCAAVSAAAGRVAANYPAGSLRHVPRLAFEAFFKHTFVSEKYLRAYEKDMEDRSVFAKATRPWMQFIRYALLKDVGEKALNGRDGWLFYRPDVDYLSRPYILDPRCQDVDYNDKKTEDAVAAIRVFKEQLASFGVDLLVVIVPGKPSIYPDMMTSRMGPETAGAFSHSLRTLRELEQAGVECVNLFAPFAGERRRDGEAGGSMYMKTDTHWGSRAVQLAAKTVADRIRRYPWFAGMAKTAEYVFDTTTVMRVGDVGVMTQLPNFRVRDLRMGFEPEATLCLPVYRVTRDGAGGIVSRAPYKDDFGPDTPILVLGDSFSRIYQTDAPRNAGWISHLALELSRPVASIVSDGGASTLVREVLARKVREARREGRRTLLDNRKLVVWEFIERDLRYGAEGWKKVDL